LEGDCCALSVTRLKNLRLVAAHPQDWLALLRSSQQMALGGGCGGDNGAFDCGPDTAW
jgi:hypothetical protein